jgi:2Fe-2S ferredoxin
VPTIHFINQAGQQTSVEARVGETVMRAALDNAIPGIIADCGGELSCATCQIHVDQDWFARLEEPSADERDMLECALDPLPTSRLSCQIVMTEALEDLIVRMPLAQL